VFTAHPPHLTRVLDFGSRGDNTAQLCRCLRAFGIPFMYHTGFGDLRKKSLGVPIVTKPASAETLITTIMLLRVADVPLHA